MNRKAFSMLLLGLSALVIFPAAMSVLSVPVASVGLNIETTNYFAISLGLIPCGDPILTPGYPG